MRFPFLPCLPGWLSVMLFAIAARGQTSTHSSNLLKGMAGAGIESSHPQQWTRRGDTLLFWAGDPAHGTALRALDTKTDETRIVWDFNLTSTHITEAPPGFIIAAAQGWLVFFPTAVWCTDGTPQGTQPVLTWTAPIYLSTGYMPLAHEGWVYFGAHDPDHGHELWCSDGTAAGTRLFKDLEPGPGSGTPEQLAVVGENIFFTATREATGAELWLTDGSAEGTRMVKDIYPGRSSSHLTEICALGSTAIFVASNGTHGSELWRSNGTAAGTTMITDLSPGYTTANPLDLTSIGSLVYFSAHTDAAGRELWKTDGTAAGTRMVKDLQPGINDSYPSGFREVNGRAVFHAFPGTGVAGHRLFSSDGTPAGTTAIHPTTLKPEWTSSELHPAPLIDGALYFVAASGSSANRSLWRTDGTAAGTRAVHASDTWTASSKALVAVDSILYHTGGTTTNARTGIEIWKWDAARTAHSLVSNLNPDGWQTPLNPPVSSSAGMFFSGFTAENGFELWRSGGTSASTTLVRDINPGTASSEIAELIEGADGRMYFSALMATSGRELWRTDGTTAGTQMVRDINAGPPGSFPSSLARLGDRLLFSARDELWASDGTAEGTVQVKDIRPGTSGSRPQYLTVLGDKIIFVANDGDHGNELWITDGTEAGTTMLKDIFATTGDVSPRIFGVAGGLAYFEQREENENYGLYATDGTTPGTTRLSAIRPANVANAATIGSTFFYLPEFTPENQWLWKSDGTPAGTVAVKQLLGPRSPGTGSKMTAAGTLVYFHSRDQELGDQLWRSDGTEAGTFVLTPAAPEWDPVRMVEIVGSVHGHVYFAATTYRHGRELWVTDGTPTGTTLALDLAPGESSSLPRWVGSHAGRVFGNFSADPESQSPSLRSLAPPEATPFFLGLELDTWPDEAVRVSLERLLSLVEAPLGASLQLELVNPLSEAGGALSLDDGRLTYLPPHGHRGDDRMTLRITGHGGPAITASVGLNVNDRPPESALQPSLRRPTAHSIEVISHVLRGQRYAFERSSDLRTWSVLETRVASLTAAARWMDATPPTGRAHYRIRPAP